MTRFFTPFSALTLLLLCGHASAGQQASAAPQAEAPAVPALVAACPAQIQTSACDLTVHHWLFSKDALGAGQLPAANAHWELVRLPHTPKREPLVVNDQWQGTMWYKTTLDLSKQQAGQQLWLQFGGAMNVADVYVDGLHLRQHLGGYLPFSVDLTPYLQQQAKQPEKVEVLVRLDNRDHALTGLKPLKQLDFNPYGGLYRPVTLALRPALHISSEQLSDTVAGGSVAVSYPHISTASATVMVATELQSAATAPASARLSQRILQNGTLVSQTQAQISLAAGKKQTLQQQLTINTPQLWSPQQPALYQLVTELWQGEQLLERQQRNIGLRTIAFNTRHQLLLNGEKTFLRGVNRHQEFPHLGYAVGPLADERDAVRIKAAGFDYVRLSHYPQSKAFMDAADRLGLLLLDAIPGWQYQSMDPAFADLMAQNCRDLIRRSRNHPSILAFECSLNETAMAPALIERLHQTVKQEAPWAYSAGWMPGFDLYLQARQHRLQHYTPPTQPYIVSEYGDWEYYAQDAGFAQHQWQGLKAEARTSRQLLSAGETRLLQQATNLQEAHNDNLRTPAFADGYWVMFDYNRGYADDLEASGLMSIYREPKYSYYLFQSQRPASEQSALYPSGPMVFIASDWSGEGVVAGQNAQVRVFSNAEQVALYLNGKLVETRTANRQAGEHSMSDRIARPPFEFSLPAFVPGTLEAKALINGKVVAEHQVHTQGPAAAIQIQVDNTGPAPAAFDEVFVKAQLVDGKGNPVRSSGVTLTFQSAELDIVNPEPVVTERGVGVVLVKTSAAGLKGRLTVSAAGLPVANIQF
ncbi:glycoside hydrolase family 2 protein [Rheinheimera texasensis]|uniref:glycoside hydrolase family 2 protein n=1 Tax=Rheinheimera texasensis TaxID=306205 RepID=UPI0009FC150A|nr:glycoside hydrolase family 2 TIM barrel-domain containing protein [Rheinheimera texasensis]